ncbi:hypothetical protein BDK88_3431 [Natrinema hispanicum]|uniref:Uncharacterized protein n=1 Tax=Natrinema hispanicum TaxID=392421 RepID=A0A482Y729_9EURY|nr:hypothetical protein BDK88_3431 [Natrinema hispanicum]
MENDNQDTDDIRKVSTDVLKECFRIAITVLFYIVLSVLGLLVAASSFNRTNILLVILGFSLGSSIIVLSVREIYRVYQFDER